MVPLFSQMKLAFNCIHNWGSPEEHDSALTPDIYVDSSVTKMQQTIISKMAFSCWSTAVLYKVLAHATWFACQVTLSMTMTMTIVFYLAKTQCYTLRFKSSFVRKL